jgi:hypothetical protein
MKAHADAPIGSISDGLGPAFASACSARFVGADSLAQLSAALGRGRPGDVTPKVVETDCSDDPSQPTLVAVTTTSYCPGMS